FSKSVQGEKISPDIGKVFHTPLFTPLKRMISILKGEISFPNKSAWIIALDEAEFLTPAQQRVLNSHLRSDAGQTFFKITTMPYCHHTMETNSEAPVVHKEDYDYVYIDSAFSKYDKTSFHDIGNFIETLVARRIQSQSPNFPAVSLENLLGHTEILGESRGGPVKFGCSDEKLIELISLYCNDLTIKRANEKFGTPGFDDQIRRKLTGALLLV